MASVVTLIIEKTMKKIFKKKFISDLPTLTFHDMKPEPQVFFFKPNFPPQKKYMPFPGGRSEAIFKIAKLQSQGSEIIIKISLERFPSTKNPRIQYLFMVHPSL